MSCFPSQEASNADIAYKTNDQIHDQVLAAIWTIGKDKDLAGMPIFKLDSCDSNRFSRSFFLQ